MVTPSFLWYEKGSALLHVKHRINLKRIKTNKNEAQHRTGETQIIRKEIKSKISGREVQLKD